MRVKCMFPQEPLTQMEPDDDDDSVERPLYIKEDDDDEPMKEEDASDDSMNDTRLSELHNTTIKDRKSVV